MINNLPEPASIICNQEACFNENVQNVSKLEVFSFLKIIFALRCCGCIKAIANKIEKLTIRRDPCQTLGNGSNFFVF